MGHDSPPSASGPDLGPLRDEYQVVGELRGSKHTRDFLASRRRDGKDVIITVCRPSPETNVELSHFAADAKLLASARHPHVLPVLDVRWLDGNALVVVREPAEGTSLADALDRGETMANPRIAAVLQEVYSALEWARGQGVVHREIAPDNLFFEEGTQRVLVAFSPAPIPITGVPDASADARTIGALAWTMITGKAYDPAAQASLAAVDPNLAARVGDVVDRLLNPKRGEPAADVLAALGIIAAGDVLKQAEVEIAATKEEYQEQHRAELAKCEAHRLDVEQQAAEAATALGEERAEWKRQVAQKENELAEARLDLDRVMAERQEQLAAVRAELETQASELERRLAEFDERRTEFEQAVFEQQQAEAETEAASALPAVLVPGSKPRSRGKKGKKTAKHAKATKQAKREPRPGEIRRVFLPLDAPPSSRGGRKKRRWLIPAGLGLLAAAVVAAVVFARHHGAQRTGSTVQVGKHTVTVTAPSIDTRPPSRGGFLWQDAGGTLAPGAFGARPQPKRDSTSAAQPTVDTTRREAETTEHHRKPRENANDVNGAIPRKEYEMPAESRTRREQANPSEPVVPRDSAVSPDTVVPRDSGGTVAAPSRDTTPRRDSTPPRRDSVVRPDTFTRPRPGVRVDTVYKRGTPVRVNPDTMRIRPAP